MIRLIFPTIFVSQTRNVRRPFHTESDSFSWLPLRRFGKKVAPFACQIAIALTIWVALLFGPGAQRSWAQPPDPSEPQRGRPVEDCKVLTDRRLETPLRTIAQEYSRLTGYPITLVVLPLAEVTQLVNSGQTQCDVVFGMPPTVDGETPVAGLDGAQKVAWKHPSREPVWAAVLTKLAQATDFVRFTGGPTGHRLWSESKAGFTIVADTSAEAYEWVAEHRTKHTYPMTATRMLAELAGIRDGICVDVGCGPGHLEIELARRSNFTIVGLDIDAGAKPLFEKRMREAGLQDRVSFVHGDAQKMPFPDDYADVIVSRGTLIFIPDLKKCLREVERVLKPGGVAFLGGRYLYAPQSNRMSTEELREIVRQSGVSGAEVIDARGQWVKIIGPQAAAAARKFQGGPHMLANRFVADYRITEGKCLVICGSDGDLEQALQRGFLDVTDMELSALYTSEKVASQAKGRIQDANLSDRITCTVGSMRALPFEDASFDVIAGVGPLLIWEKDKGSVMREIYRVLRPGGAALVGGRFLHMPEFRRVPTESLRQAAAATGLTSIRVLEDMGQWVEIRKGTRP